MKRIVDIYRNGKHDQVLWIYIVSLGGAGSHTWLEDLKEEALGLAALDKRDTFAKLDAFIHLDISQ